MRKQSFIAAMLCSIAGASESYAVEKDQSPWNDILRRAGQTSQIPTFGPQLGEFTAVTAEGLQQELPDDRFVSADRFPPTRLVFPDGTQEPEPKGGAPYTVVSVLKVVPVTGERVLQAYAKDVPFDPDVLSSSPAVQDTSPPDYQLLFDQRRVKEWGK
jgi:hypothetical protein